MKIILINFYVNCTQSLGENSKKKITGVSIDNYKNKCKYT